MFGVDKIRTAMFARAPHGYLPNDVDVLLDELIARADMASPAELLALVESRAFSDAENGYDRGEVDELLAEAEADLRADAFGAGDPAVSEIAAPVEPTDYDAVPYEAAPYDAAPYEVAPYEGAPHEPVAFEAEVEPGPEPHELPADYVAPSARLDLPSVAAAVNRMKTTVSNLDTLIAHEVTSVQAACERQVEEINRECDAVIAEARAAAEAHVEAVRRNSADVVAKAEAEADLLRAAADVEIAELRAAFEAEMAAARRAAEGRIAEMEAESHAHAGQLTAEATRRCDEADRLVEEARALRAGVLRSIEDARNALGTIGA
jgi:cell division septum initiation protein DivIVA